VFLGPMGPFGRKRSPQPVGGVRTIHILNDKDLSRDFLAAHNALGPLPQARVKRVLGLDLGQAHDPSAGCMLETDASDGNLVGPKDPRLYCKYLREWPLGYSYVDLVEDIITLAPDVIVPEFNSVGRPFVDLLRIRARQENYRGVILPVVTAASNAKMEAHTEARGKHLTVPKQDLVTSILIAQQQNLLRFLKCRKKGCPRSCKPMCIVHKLFDEMATFQKRYSRTSVSFGNEPGAHKHDDLVIATGLACFYLTRYGYRREPAIVF
jgi:hypothetical protein